MKKNDQAIVIAPSANDALMLQQETPAFTCKDMRSLYSGHKGKRCQSIPIIVEYIEKIADMEQTEKKIKKEKEILKSRIMEYMKECDTLMDGNKILATWKSRNRGQLNIALLKADYLPVYRACIKNQLTRYFELGRQVKSHNIA